MTTKAKRKVRIPEAVHRGRERGEFTTKVLGLKPGQSFIEKKKTRQVIGSLVYRAANVICDGDRKFTTKNVGKNAYEITRVKMPAKKTRARSREALFGISA